MGGEGSRDVETTNYSGLSELEKDVSCCLKCNLRDDCEYWVRATDDNICWLRSNDGKPIKEISSWKRRGGFRKQGKQFNIVFEKGNSLHLHTQSDYRVFSLI